MYFEPTLFHKMDTASCCFIVFGLTAVLGYFLWNKINKTSRYKKTPYKIVRGGKVTDKTRKRVCAVVGGTGFIGSHVVNELVKRKEYHVYVLGRKFHPERNDPDADCLIQVDMQDKEGLEKAFEGVDSVINCAIVFPSVYLSADDLYDLNTNGFENIINAAKKAGVKHLVHTSALGYEKPPKDPVMKAFFDSFYLAEEKFLKANGVEGLKTCAVGPPHVIGAGNAIIEPILSGKTTSTVMADLPVTFVPVEYVARALVNAESKLASDVPDEVAGKGFLLRGEKMSWREFFSLPSWPQKFSETPFWFIKLLAYVNLFCARFFGWAPFGPELTSGIFGFINEFVEKEIEDSECTEAQRVLGLGPSNPPMEEYVKELVDRYKTKEESRKEK